MKPRLICPIAIAGTGKSTFGQELVARGYIEEDAIVSLDKLRLATTGKIDDFSTNGEVIEIARSIVSARLSRGLTTYMDSTHLTGKARKWSTWMAEEHHARLVWVRFDVAYEQSLAQNNARGRVVPLDVMESQRARYESIDWSGLSWLITISQDYAELDLTRAPW